MARHLVAQVMTDTPKKQKTSAAHHQQLRNTPTNNNHNNKLTAGKNKTCEENSRLE